MSNLNNLTSKILNEAKTACDEILANAHEEEAKIMEKKISEARKVEENIINKAKSEALARKDRIISNAELSTRNKKLAAKQIIIEKVFQKALEALNSLSDDEYLSFIKQSIASMDLQGDYNLVLGKQGIKYITEQFVGELNNAFLSSGKSVRISLNSNAGNFQGGFILEKSGIEINSTFEALISSMRDELEYEVTKVLFS